MDLDLLARRLRDTYGHGTVERADGGVTFSWVNMARPAMGTDGQPSRAGESMTLHPDGTLSSRSHAVGPGAGWREGESQALPLRFSLPRLVEEAFVPDDTEHGREGVVADAARALARWMTSDDARRLGLQGDAERAAFAREAGVGDLLAAARGFLGRLDPEALRLFRRHWHHRVWLSDAWADLLRRPGRGAPLAEALDRHPGFPNAVMRVHEAVGGDAMAANLGRRGWLDGMVVEDLSSRPPAFGVDSSLASLAARVERGLGPYMDRVALAGHADPRLGVSMAGIAMPERYMDDWAVGVARTLRMFPPAWVPVDAGQWEAFGDLLLVIRSVGHEARDDANMTRVLPSGGDWVGMRRRLVAAARVPVERLHDALRDSQDMVGAYANEVLVAADHEGHRADLEDDPDSQCLHRLGGQARQVLVGGRTLARVLELSAEWHRRQARMRADLAGMPGSHRHDDGWPAGLPDAAYGDVEVRVLRDVAALVAEGAAGVDGEGAGGLNNCLAGYGEACRSGRSRIVSLRRRLPTGGFERLSAAEVHVDFGELREGQHVGHDDGPAPRGMAALLSRYLSECRAGVLDVDRAGLTPVPVDPGRTVMRLCGYDPSVEPTRLAVRAMWDRFVPRPFRAMDRDMLRSLPSPPVRCGWPGAAPIPMTPQPAPRLTEPDDMDEDFAFPMVGYRGV